MSRTIVRLALLLALFGCEEEAAPITPGGDPGSGGAPAVEPDLGAPPSEAAPLTRAPGRMTIEQLARSIPIITDGIAWTEDFGAGPTDMLQVLAPTLGAPDYLRVTEENLEPTLIIAKFMQDASNRICVRWAQRDAEAADRSLVVHDGPWDSLDEAHARAALRALQLRFYGRHVPPDDDAAIDDLYALFVNASSTAPAARAARDGWLAVCIAMMTDPEFVLY